MVYLQTKSWITIDIHLIYTKIIPLDSSSLQERGDGITRYLLPWRCRSNHNCSTPIQTRGMGSASIWGFKLSDIYNKSFFNVMITSHNHESVRKLIVCLIIFVLAFTWQSHEVLCRQRLWFLVIEAKKET